MDALVVSVAAGLTLGCITRRHVFRLAFHFGLFQFLMPIVGWLAGSAISSHVLAYGHWLAFGLLSFIGGKMLLDACSKRERQMRSDPTKGWLLVGLSVATSIDAFAAGLSMALLQVPIVLPCVVIGLVAAAFSAVGITFANGSLRRWKRAAEVLGAGVLIMIGFKILASHWRGTM